MFAFFYQPYPLFPILGACSLGKINWFTENLFWNDYFMFLITTELVGSCAISILAAIFYRVLVLYNADSWLRRLNSTIGRSMIAITFIVIYGIVTVILANVLAMIEANMGTAMQEVKLTNPELFALLSSQHCFIAQIDDQFRVVLLLATICIFAAMLVTVGLVIAALLALWLRRHSLSANAYRMHTQFIRALIFQIAVPFLTMYVPITVWIFGLYFGISWPSAINDFLFLQCSFHSALNVLLMVLCTRPYWRATCQLFSPLHQAWQKIVGKFKPSPVEVKNAAKQQQKVGITVVHVKSNFI